MNYPLLRAMVSSIQDSLGNTKAELILSAVKIASDFNVQQKKEKSRLVKHREFVPGNSFMHKLVFKNFNEIGHPLKLTWMRRDQFSYIYDYFTSIKLLEDGYSINANEYKVFKWVNRKQWVEYFRNTETKASLIRRVANEIVDIEKKMLIVNSCIEELENIEKSH